MMDEQYRYDEEFDGFDNIKTVTIPKNGTICLLGTAIMASDKNFIAKTRFPKNVTKGKPIEWHPETVTTKNPIIITAETPEIIYAEPRYQPEPVISDDEELLPISFIQCENQNEECTIQFTNLKQSGIQTKVDENQNETEAYKAIVSTFDESSENFLSISKKTSSNNTFKMHTSLTVLSEKKRKFHYDKVPDGCYFFSYSDEWKPSGDIVIFLKGECDHPLNAISTLNWSLVEQNTTDRKFFFPKNVRFVVPHKRQRRQEIQA